MTLPPIANPGSTENDIIEFLAWLEITEIEMNIKNSSLVTEIKMNIKNSSLVSNDHHIIIIISSFLKTYSVCNWKLHSDPWSLKNVNNIISPTSGKSYLFLSISGRRKTRYYLSHIYECLQVWGCFAIHFHNPLKRIQPIPMNGASMAPPAPESTTQLSSTRPTGGDAEVKTACKTVTNV